MLFIEGLRVSLYPNQYQVRVGLGLVTLNVVSNKVQQCTHAETEIGVTLWINTELRIYLILSCILGQ